MRSIERTSFIHIVIQQPPSPLNPLFYYDTPLPNYPPSKWPPNPLCSQLCIYLCVCAIASIILSTAGLPFLFVLKIFFHFCPFNISLLYSENSTQCSKCNFLRLMLFSTFSSVKWLKIPVFKGVQSHGFKSTLCLDALHSVANLLFCAKTLQTSIAQRKTKNKILFVQTYTFLIPQIIW